MSESKLFCVYPWTHLFIDNSGKQFPCCFAQKYQGQTPRGPSIRESQTIGDLWNSDYLKTVRRDFQRGEFPAACLICKKQETGGQQSHREWANDNFSEVSTTPALADGTLEAPIRSIDLRLGNICNLKCRMCHPSSSNQLTREWLESGDEDLMLEAKNTVERPAWSTSESVMELFESPQVDLHHVHFAGGEPAIEPNHRRLLKWLIEKGQSSKVRVTYNTNLTKPLFILDHIEKFGVVEICVSIDGLGAVNDYIRAPSQWKDIEKNFIALLDLRSKYDDLRIMCNMTVQTYNILRVTEFYKYLAGLAADHGPFDPHFDFVSDPAYLNPRVLPLKLRQRAIADLERGLREVRFVDEGNQSVAEEQLHRMIKYLKTAPTDDEQQMELFRQFENHTRRMDAARGQNVLHILPELEPYWGIVSLENMR